VLDVEKYGQLVYVGADVGTKVGSVGARVGTEVGTRHERVSKEELELPQSVS